MTLDLLPDVICLCETWMNESISNAYVNIENFNLICRKDRSDTKSGIGGGLLIYVKEGLKCREISNEAMVDFNQCCAVSITNDFNIVTNILLVYRPHSLYDGEDTELNNQRLNNVMKSLDKATVVVGDFNYSDIDWVNERYTRKSEKFFDHARDV